MRVCIHCLEKKHESAFNAEHVIPQAFGKFEPNAVLDCVCTACNKYFGDTIDMKLARDSLEGIDRFWSGIKPASEFKSLGTRSTTKVKFKDGAVQGGFGYPAANPDGDDLRVFALPQVGIEQKPDPMKWFLVDELPEREQLPQHGVDLKREFFIHVREMSAEDAGALLASKGYTKLDPFTATTPPIDIIDTETVGIVGRPEKRAATKIALNYLAWVVGPAAIRAAPFDDVRSFARHDHGDSRVHISKNPWRFLRNGRDPSRGHYLSVQTMPSGRIVAQVSLMLQLRYVVHLMSANFVTGTRVVSSAHFFDIDTWTVRPIPVPRLVPGEQLTVAGTHD